MMAYYLNSQSIISLTLFVMAAVLTTYLFKSNDRSLAGRWLLWAFIAQVMFMVLTFFSTSLGFWGTLFYGPQYIVAIIYTAFMIQFAYHYPYSDKKDEARRIWIVSILVVLIVTLLSVWYAWLLVQPDFKGILILRMANSLSLLTMLSLSGAVYFFLRQSIHRSKCVTIQEIQGDTCQANIFQLLLRPCSSDAVVLRNLSLAFLFSFLPAIAQPLIVAGLVGAATGFYIYSLGLLAQLLVIYIAYINHSRQSISYVSKLVSFSMGIMMAILGGVAWKNADSFDMVLKNNIQTQIDMSKNHIMTDKFEYFPSYVSYIVSWRKQGGQFSDYQTLYSRYETFSDDFIQLENRQQQSEAERFVPYPESSEVVVIEQLRSIDMDNIVRYDDLPVGSTPRYIGYQFDYDGRRYEIGFRMADLLLTIHNYMLPMFYMVFISCLIIGILLPVVLKILIVKPLNRLLTGIEQYTLYDEISPLPVQYEDEIGYLTHAFNAMLQTIQKSEAELVQMNNELEERVAARTAELSESNRQLKKEIVERKRVEQQLIIARDAAESAARTKSEFLAMMSHEIRTPLNAIIGMTSLLMTSSHSSEESEYIETIRSSSDNLLSIINHVLDFSKIETGSVDLEEHSFELVGCIEDVLDLVAVRQPVANIDLVYSIAPDVPEYICGDISRLRQVLVNLVGNAVKFTNEGEVLVSVEKWKSGDHVVVGTGDGVKDEKVTLAFSIKDTGIGIAKESMSRLFKPFSQADASTTRKYGGTGLGLAISRRLVDIMDGELSVSSEVGIGSTFSFTIRVKEGQAESVDESDIMAMDVLQGKSILIVDDNASSRSMLDEICRRWQMEPLAFSAGSLALEQLALGKNFDVALIDLYMPEMGGVQLAAKIRHYQQMENIPLILLSSSHKSSRGERALRPELFLANLSKPIKVSNLRKVLTSVLSNINIRPEDITLAEPVLDPKLAERVPLRILIAEDNPVNQRLAIRVFEKMGYQVDIASNGLEVLEATARQKYDLIFMDIQMPEMDGLEATKKLIEKKPAHLPRIVAMTANALDGDRERCLAAGMDDYISKPVRLSDIQTAIERWGQGSND